MVPAGRPQWEQVVPVRAGGIPALADGVGSAGRVEVAQVDDLAPRRHHKRVVGAGSGFEDPLVDRLLVAAPGRLAGGEELGEIWDDLSDPVHVTDPMQRAPRPGAHVLPEAARELVE